MPAGYIIIGNNVWKCLLPYFLLSIHWPECLDNLKIDITLGSQILSSPSNTEGKNVKLWVRGFAEQWSSKKRETMQTSIRFH